MATRRSTRSSFEEKVVCYLAQNEDAKDVTFLVGPQKKEITALKIALQVACPALDVLFKNNWSKCWEKGNLLVPLPDVDPVAFQIFLETLLWSELEDEEIQKLNLPPETMTHLVVISKKLQMTEIYDLFRTLKTSIQGRDDDSNIGDQCKSLDLKIKLKNQQINSSTTESLGTLGQNCITTTGVHTEGNMSVAGNVITVIGPSAPMPVPPVTTFYEIDPPTPSFTGRVNLLQQIHCRMQDCSTKTDYASRIVVICGLGGIGKTEIARKYAKEFITDAFIRNVAWIDAETRTSLKTSFDSLAASLNLSTSESNLRDLTVALAVYQHFSAHIGTGLFIFDNAPQFNEEQFRIYDFLPKTESLHRRPLILITARDKRWEIPKENIITVEELSCDESVQLLSNKLDLCFEAQSCDNQCAIRKLACAFQGFPLGLSLAASNIDFVDQTDVEDQIEDYLKRMEVPRGGWGEDTQPEAATKYSLVMQNVWEMTLRKIKDLQGGGDAISLLRLMAFSPTDQITVQGIADLFEFAFSRAVATRAFFILEKKSMISLEKMPNFSRTSGKFKSARTRIKIHRLVQHCTRESLELEDAHSWLAKICDYVCKRKLNLDEDDTTSALLCAHEHLRIRKWPQNSIRYSVIFCSLIIFFENEHTDALIQLVKDVYKFLNIGNIKLAKVQGDAEKAVGLFCLCVLWINTQNEKYPGYEFLLANKMLGKQNFEIAVLLFKSHGIQIDVPSIFEMELDTLERYMFNHCYQILYNQMTADRTRRILIATSKAVLKYGAIMESVMEDEHFKKNDILEQTSQIAEGEAMTTFSFLSKPTMENGLAVEKAELIAILRIVYREFQSVNNDKRKRAEEYLLWSNTMNGFPLREDHAAVGVGNKIYVFGGFSKYGHPSYTRHNLDVFVLDVDDTEMEWRPVSVSTATKGTKLKFLSRVIASPNPSFVAPNQRHGHTAVAFKECAFIFGGNDIKKNQFSSSTYRFDTVTQKWDKPNVSGKFPAARSDHSAVVIRNSMVVFGGKSYFENLTYDVHCLDLESFLWSTIEIQGISPPLFCNHSATVHDDRFMLIFGGRSSESKCVNTVMSFDYDTKAWSVLETTGTPPSSREDHCAFMHDGLMYIFGGYSGIYLNDLLSYNPETFEWKRVAPIGNVPSLRKGAGCVVLNDQVFIFGGIEFISYLDDTCVVEIQ